MIARKLLLAASLSTVLAGAAQAQVSVKLGVLNDMSGLYADISGRGSVVAARMAVEDFKAADKGIKAEIARPTTRTSQTMAPRSLGRDDQEGVDLILDVPTSTVSLAVAEVTREKNKVLMVSAGGTSDLTGSKCTPNNVHWTFDTWALANGTGSAMTEARW